MLYKTAYSLFNFIVLSITMSALKKLKTQLSCLRCFIAYCLNWRLFPIFSLLVFTGASSRSIVPVGSLWISLTLLSRFRYSCGQHIHLLAVEVQIRRFVLITLSISLQPCNLVIRNCYLQVAYCHFAASCLWPKADRQPVPLK